ncbi:DISARM system phospholipase D-like protein DrmC [Paludisphaera sp. Pla2]|uniref:DISARM system phospholipase D-like protein DrmC n=1 Tax=Paludisphaera mucosa TaxID=3030827 RepID=A0ABT6F5G3_9BACT|nr:DISARM system phospholipase D-like protein DrmC [Paludisphaera mucosa]
MSLQMVAHSVRAQRESHSAELVWTGPDAGPTAFRRTEQAIIQVLDAARNRITLISFAIYKIPKVVETLVRAAGRGVLLTVVVETPDRIAGQGEYSTIRALGPEVAACSTVYYWPGEDRLVGANGKAGLLHVKCAAADGEWLFISSANLTRQAFTINMELGILVRDDGSATAVERHFDRLIQVGRLQPI